MYKMLIFLLALCSSFAIADNADTNEEQPGLLESLEMFFERNGGEKDLLGKQQKEEPLIEMEGAIKNLLEELSQDKSSDSE